MSDAKPPKTAVREKRSRTPIRGATIDHDGKLW
jgi:hypothetical protein